MFKQFIARNRQWLAPGSTVVAAVSGGADSMCLAHLLWRVAQQGGPEVHIAHVNHQLRGKAAVADADYVRRWSEDHGLACTVVKLELQRRGGQSLQEHAREERYRVLVDICVRVRATKLFTGHHSDDQVETFLLNLIRGSGSQGLRGIPAVRQLERGVKVFRPILAFSREEIEQYCLAHAITWRTDSSNEKTDYYRNRIRHNLLPQLRKLNPGIDRVLLNTMETIEREQLLLDELTGQALAEIKVTSPLPFAPAALSVDGLSKLHSALQYRVIAAILGRKGLSRHIEAVLGLLNGNTGSCIDLPGQRAYRLSNSIAFGGRPRSLPAVEEHISIPGAKEIGAFGIRIEASLEPLPGGDCFWLSEDVSCLEITRRRPGDYFYPGQGGKKLKDYLIDKKIPRWLRDEYPVIRAGGDIIWVVGLIRDRRFLRQLPGTRPVFITINSREEKDNA